MVPRSHDTIALVVGALLLGVCISMCTTTAMAADPVLVDDTTEEIKLGLHLDYLEDKEGSLTLDDVLSPEVAAQFVASEVETPNFGLGLKSAYWFSFALQNVESKTMNRYLEIGYPHLDNIDVYLFLEASEPVHHHLGRKLLFRERPVDHRNFVIPIEILPRAQLRVLIRVKSSSSLRVPITLWGLQDFWEQDSSKITTDGLFFGLVLVMALYNGFVFFSLRERSYLYYVIFVTGFAGFQAAISGLSYQYLWPNLPWWSEKSLLFFIGMTVVGGGLFTNEFLELREHAKRHFRFILVLLFIVQLSNYRMVSIRDASLKNGSL